MNACRHPLFPQVRRQIVPLGGLITINSVLLSIIFLKEYTHIPNKVTGVLITLVGAVLVL